MHPEIVGLEHLLYDIARASFASVVFGYVFRYCLDLGACVGGTYGQSAELHDFVVGDIVAHIHHFFVAEMVLGAQLFVLADFLCHSLMYLSESEPLVAELYGLCGGSCDDCEEELLLHCMLHGIAVLDVDRTHGFARGVERDGLPAEHSVDIEEDGAYAG